ncbi:MAG: 30S ribosomal protein S16 [Paludibacteraceae bacterium]|nr:30S ribosomal protein S16 [Paludibacteraceae bacterium]
MATKIRLARHGHKDYAFYHIVVADSRSPRDGKIIERIGSFNPNTNPAAVILNFDRALYWVTVGAQPTDTVRTILSGEGVLLMKHLNGGVAKGAFSQEEAQKRFDAWKAERDAKNGKISKAEADKKAAAEKALHAQEVEANKAKAAAVAQKRAEAAAELAAAAQEAAKEAAAAEAEAKGEEIAEEAEAPAEEPAAEEPAAEEQAAE